jgi:hypothetical protein
MLSSSFIKHSLTIFIMGTSFVINGVAMYKIALLISQNAWRAFVAALAVSLGTMLWPYSAVYYGYAPAAMCLCVAFYLLFSMSRSPEKIALRRFFWAGLMLGVAFITDYTTAPIIAGLVVYTLYIIRRQKPSNFIIYGIGGAFGAIIPLSAMFIYNGFVYGTPFTFGYIHQFTPQLQQQVGLSGTIGTKVNPMVLYRITLDPQFGLFWQSPVLVLAFIGYFTGLRTTSFRAEGLVSLFAVASTLLINTAILPWWGGHAFGPRYLIIGLPFFIIPLMLLPDSFNWAMGILGTFSAVQMLIPLTGQIQIAIDWIASRNQFWVENKPFQGFSVLWEYGLPLIFKSLRSGTPSWTLGYAIRFLPYRLYLSLPILVGVESFLIGLFHKQTRAETLQAARNT